MLMVRMLAIKFKQLHLSLDYLLINRLIIDDFIVIFFLLFCWHYHLSSANISQLYN